jgi:hypothetical protein
MPPLTLNKRLIKEHFFFLAADAGSNQAHLIVTCHSARFLLVAFPLRQCRTRYGKGDHYHDYCYELRQTGPNLFHFLLPLLDLFLVFCQTSAQRLCHAARVHRVSGALR